MAMPIMERHARELERAVRRALREHGTVREAAASLGLPKSTLFDYMTQRRRAARKRRRRKVRR